MSNEREIKALEKRITGLKNEMARRSETKARKIRKAEIEFEADCAVLERTIELYQQQIDQLKGGEPNAQSQ